MSAGLARGRSRLTSRSGAIVSLTPMYGFDMGRVEAAGRPQVGHRGATRALSSSTSVAGRLSSGQRAGPPSHQRSGAPCWSGINATTSGCRVARSRRDLLPASVTGDLEPTPTCAVRAAAVEKSAKFLACIAIVTTLLPFLIRVISIGLT